MQLTWKLLRLRFTQEFQTLFWTNVGGAFEPTTPTFQFHEFKRRCVPYIRVEAEMAFVQDKSAAEICKMLGAAEQTYLRWPLSYIGLQIYQAKKL